jgi:Cys-rich protein (TIGR04453 family)
MKTSIIALVALIGLTTLGCGSVEDECETFCEWYDDCIGGAGSDCTEECVETYDEADDDCQESFDELAACFEEDDSCDEGSDCVGEIENFVDDCENEFD